METKSIRKQLKLIKEQVISLSNLLVEISTMPEASKLLIKDGDFLESYTTIIESFSLRLEWFNKRLTKMIEGSPSDRKRSKPDSIPLPKEEVPTNTKGTVESRPKRGRLSKRKP